VELSEFAELAELKEKSELMESIPAPPGNLHLYIEHDVCGMEYSVSQLVLAAWLCSLPALAHLLIS